MYSLNSTAARSKRQAGLEALGVRESRAHDILKSGEDSLITLGDQLWNGIRVRPPKQVINTAAIRTGAQEVVTNLGVRNAGNQVQHLSHGRSGSFPGGADRLGGAWAVNW